MSEETSSTDVEAPLSRGEKLKQLIRLIPGPDFPTAGFIIGRGGIAQAYTTGRGSIYVAGLLSLTMYSPSAAAAPSLPLSSP